MESCLQVRGQFVRICDKCGVKANGYDHQLQTLHFFQPYSLDKREIFSTTDESADLCVNCTKLFIDFLQVKP